MLILLFSIVRNVISVSSVKSQVTHICSLRVFSKCLCQCLCLCHCICLCQFVFGHVMSSHHSEQMSQRSQVSRMALRRCSQNVFVTVLFVFVIFFGHMTCIFSCIWPAYDLHVMSVSSSCHIRLDIATTAGKTSPKVFNWAMGDRLCVQL